MGGREAREGERAAGGEKSLGNTEERKGRGAKVSSGEAGPGCKGCRREAQVNSPTGAENTDGETSTRGRMFVKLYFIHPDQNYLKFHLFSLLILNPVV